MKTFDTVQPEKAGKSARRTTVFRCDEYDAQCPHGALCDACTAFAVERLTPQVLHGLQVGTWRTVTIVFLMARFSDEDICRLDAAQMRALLRDIKKEIRHVMRAANLNGTPIIAGIDIDLEEVRLEDGYQYWQIHLHGFVEVGPAANRVMEKMRRAFGSAPSQRSTTGAAVKISAPLATTFNCSSVVQRAVAAQQKNAMRAQHRPRAPVVFKTIRDPVNWLSYSLKEPSRMLDKHVTVIFEGRQKRLRQKLKARDLAVERHFLRSITVRDRLFLQGYDVLRNWRLVRKAARLAGPTEPQAERARRAKQAHVPIRSQISKTGTGLLEPMGAIRTR